jgi:hypothetical protein
MSANPSPLKQEITSAMKTAMKSGDKQRLATIRLMLAAAKQIEIDERRDLSDADLLAVLDKMVKQRRDSVSQFKEAGRDDLVAQEESEMEVIQDFLPQPLSEAEVVTLITAAIADADAKTMQDMGKVMGLLKPQLQGRADMGKVSGQIKAQLG